MVIEIYESGIDLHHEFGETAAHGRTSIEHFTKVILAKTMLNEEQIKIIVRYLDPITYIVSKVGKKVKFGGIDVNMKKYSETCINY